MFPWETGVALMVSGLGVGEMEWSGLDMTWNEEKVVYDLLVFQKRIFAFSRSQGGIGNGFVRVLIRFLEIFPPWCSVWLVLLSLVTTMG